MSNLTAETIGDTQVRFTRRFSAPPQRVFDAHYQADLVRQWMTGPPGWTMPTCEITPEVGSVIRVRWENAEGESFGFDGKVLELEPPHRSLHTELFSFPGATETVVETKFQPEGTGTLLVLTVTYASEEARAGALASGMVDGMEMSYARIDPLLAGT